MHIKSSLIGLAVMLALGTHPYYAYADNFEDGLEEEVDDEFEESFYGDEDFVSIATGTRKAIHKVPAVATVITSADIENLGANSVYDILEEVVGVTIYPNTHNRMSPNFSIRGIHTQVNPQTLLLVNGVRMTYEFSGARYNQLQVSTENIDRIEVIRGPGSAVYGADAYSGVINIITKGVNSVETKEMGAKGGAFGTQSIWGNYIHKGDELQYSFNGQYYDTDGDDGRIVNIDRMYSFGDFGIGLSNAPGPLDTRRETYDMRAEVKYGGFKGSVWHLKNESGTGPGIAYALSDGDWEELKATTVTAGYRWEGDSTWNTEVNFIYQKMNQITHFIIFPPGMAFPHANGDGGFTVFTDGYIGQPHANDKNLNASLVTHYSGIDKHNIRVEVGYRYSEEKPQEYKNFGNGQLTGNEDFVDGTLVSVRGTPYIYLDDVERELGFVSVQDEWQVAADWEFVAGARLDRYSDFGSTFNPRMALVWETDRLLTTKFLYGTAFRAPSMQELYVTNNPVTKGNPDLEPETISFYEIAFDYHNHVDWQVTANIYTYKSEDLITASISDDGINRFNNAGQQDGYGAEFEAKWKPSDVFDARFGYSWQNSESGTNNERIPEAPRQLVNLSFNWAVNEFFDVHMNSHWVIDRARALTDLRDPIDDYNWTNLVLSYRFSENLVTKLTVRNLFDTDARAPSLDFTPEDFPLEGRGAWLSLQYKF